MRTKAAVLRAVGGDWEITELELDPPKAGEVLIRFTAAGLCHSDDHLCTGDKLTLFEKRIVGSLFGSGNPFEEIPRVLDLYRAGRLKLDELITSRYRLEDLSQGYRDMLDGRNVRGLLVHEH